MTERNEILNVLRELVEAIEPTNGWHVRATLDKALKVIDAARSEEVVPTTQTNDQIAAVMLMCGDKGQVAEAVAYSRGMLAKAWTGCKVCYTSPCACPPYAPWVDPEPGEHSEVIAAIEAHNTGEEE